MAAALRVENGIKNVYYSACLMIFYYKTIRFLAFLSAEGRRSAAVSRLSLPIHAMRVWKIVS